MGGRSDKSLDRRISSVGLKIKADGNAESHDIGSDRAVFSLQGFGVAGEDRRISLACELGASPTLLVSGNMLLL